MALYFYQAFSKDGKKVTGSIDAPSLQNVKEQLSRQGLYPTAITAGEGAAKGKWFSDLFTRGVSIKDKILFTKQLSVLLRSGIPLLQAFELLADQFEGSLRRIIINIKDDIKEGRSFADALKKYPKVFENIYVQLVRAGEASGNLEMILDRLTTYLERRAEIKKKVSAAFRTPMIQLGIMVIIVVGLLTFVVPKMAENFASQGQELPGPTKFLMTVSNAILSHYLLILIAVVCTVMGFLYWRSTPAGARKIDELKLRLPIIKYFTRTNAVVQFSQTLGMLTEGGVNLAESLDIVCSIVDNRILAETLNEARDKIIKQGKIAQYLKQTNIFPPMAIYLIKTGEESGELGVMLLTVANNYEEKLKELTDALAESLPTMILLVMAVVVGFIIMALALPILKMNESIAGGF